MSKNSGNLFPDSFWEEESPSSRADEEDIPQITVIRIPPFSYVHIFDNNSNISRMEKGPITLTCLDHEQVIFGPEKMVIIPPRHYCTILNPVIFDPETNEILKDKYGQAKLRHGELEIRLEQDPFPLYPGEKLMGKIEPLMIVNQKEALVLQAIRDFQDGDKKRKVGDEWMFIGPQTYFPRVEVKIARKVESILLHSHQALHMTMMLLFMIVYIVSLVIPESCVKYLCLSSFMNVYDVETEGFQMEAFRDCKDWKGISRKAGEEWLVKTVGAYIPGADEKVVKKLDAVILKKNENALHLRAKRSFVDIYKKHRKAGDEWLVTFEDNEIHIPDVYEEVVKIVSAILLKSNQFCIIQNPVDEEGKPQLGHKKQIIGPANVLLQPGEIIEGAGVKNSTILRPYEALLIRAKEKFRDMYGKEHHPGDRWLVYGPREYYPPIEVEILRKRTAMIRIDPLGIYLIYSPASLALLIFALVILFWLLLF